MKSLIRLGGCRTCHFVGFVMLWLILLVVFSSWRCVSNEPRHKKICLQWFAAQTGLLSYGSKHCLGNADIETIDIIFLRGCAGWSVPLLFSYGIRQVFSWRGSNERMLKHALLRSLVRVFDVMKIVLGCRLYSVCACWSESSLGWHAILLNVAPCSNNTCSLMSLNNKKNIVHWQAE